MPDEFSCQIGIAAGPNGSFAVLVIPTWSGAPEQGEDQLKTFLELGTLIGGAIERKSYRALLNTFDSVSTSGMRGFVECCWLRTLDCANIDTMVAAMSQAVSPGCMIFTHDFRDAATRVPWDATAFAMRRDHVLVDVATIYPDRADPLDDERHRAWARATRTAFTRALPGGYPNMLGRDAADRAAMSFGDNARRLMRAKRHFDPDNVFSSAIPLPDSCD
jgi:FAD/FMN-containing dehydrogenase